MNRSLLWLTLLCALLILSCATVARADYGAGQAAWQAGRYAEALKEWRQAARQGDKRAMVALGRAFAKGLGAPQDFVEAHKWLNLAAARGDEKAAEERDALEKKMTAGEHAEARKLARAWRNADRRRTTAIPPRRRAPGTPRPPRRMVLKGSPGRAALRAATAGNISALEKALAAGADPDARGRRGWTPLMYAANKGYTLLVPPLLKAGAKPNLRAADGATALFIAALHGHSEIFAQLMRKGADISIPGPKGKLPLEVARNLKHMSIIALPEVVALQQAEARKKQEAAERKMRDEAMRREREESAAFEQTKASDTPRAWSEFLSSWCPGSKLCPSAGSRLDESLRTSLTGKSFSGHDSLGESLLIQYPSPDQVILVHDLNKYSGTWEVENGKVRIRFEYGGFLSCSAVAELVDNHLEGREECAVNSMFYKGNKRFTWRLAERTAAEIDAGKKAATAKPISPDDDNTGNED